jgi:hypothetical protein
VRGQAAQALAVRATAAATVKAIAECLILGEKLPAATQAVSRNFVPLFAFMVPHR